MKGRGSEAKLLSAIISVAGLAIIAYSLLATQNVSNSHDGMMWMGSSTASSYYGLTNMVLAIVGTFILASGILYTITRVEYEPMNYPMTFVPVAQAGSPKPVVTSSTASSLIDSAPIADSSISDSQGAPTEASRPSALNEQNYLILRLLTGDERTMFRAIVDSGGEALQKDLIVSTKMSEAKVSRVIDRLVEKGVVSKERNGMGNKITIHIDT